MTDNHFKPWTADEVSELKRLDSMGASTDEIATALGRTPDAVATRRKTGRGVPRPVSLKQW